MVVFHRAVTVFDDEELHKFMKVTKIQPHSVEIGCGCTSRRLGDTAGTLKIFDDKKLQVAPRCNLGWLYWAKIIGNKVHGKFCILLLTPDNRAAALGFEIILLLGLHMGGITVAIVEMLLE